MLKAFLNRFKNYKRYFFSSLSLHVGVLLFFILSFEVGFNRNQLPPRTGDIIQATVLNQADVDKEIQNIKTAEIQKVEAKKAAEKAAEKALNDKLVQIKKAQQEEQLKLEKIKKDILVAKEKEQKEKKALEDAKLAAQKKEKLTKEKAAKDASEAIAKQKAAKEKQLAAAKAAREAREAQGRIDTAVSRARNVWIEQIRHNKRQALGLDPDLSCRVAITVLPDGSANVRLVKSSGNSTYDDLSMNVVYKSEPFQLPEDPAVFEQAKSFSVGLTNREGDE